MKHKLKKLNRGLVLAALLIIGLIIFIAVDNHNFKTEKPQIEDNISEFIQELAEYNVTPEKYRELGKSYSEEDAEKKKADFSELVDKYWISSDDINDPYGMILRKSDMKLLINRFFDKQNGFVTEIKSELRECKISKDGPNAAIAECEIKIIGTATENSAFVTSSGMSGSYSETAEDDSLYTTSLDERCTFYLERTQDGWKITGSDGYLMGFQSYPIYETDSEEEGAA